MRREGEDAAAFIGAHHANLIAGASARIMHGHIRGAWNDEREGDSHARLAHIEKGHILIAHPHGAAERATGVRKGENRLLCGPAIRICLLGCPAAFERACGRAKRKPSHQKRCTDEHQLQWPGDHRVLARRA
jgi:hypothetical protein